MHTNVLVCRVIAGKIIFIMTYDVSSGTLNPAIL